MTKAPDRFTLVDRHLSEGGGGCMEPDYQGEWMLYEDLPALLAAERKKALREAASVALNYPIAALRRSGISDTILALIDTETDPQPDLPRTSEPQAGKPSVQEAQRYIHDLITSRILPAKEGQSAIAALGIEQEG